MCHVVCFIYHVTITSSYNMLQYFVNFVGIEYFYFLCNILMSTRLIVCNVELDRRRAGKTILKSRKG